MGLYCFVAVHYCLRFIEEDLPIRFNVNEGLWEWGSELFGVNDEINNGDSLVGRDKKRDL